MRQDYRANKKASYFWRTKVFKGPKAKEKFETFLKWHPDTCYEKREIFINNGYGLEYRRIRKIDLI